MNSLSSFKATLRIIAMIPTIASTLHLVPTDASALTWTTPAVVTNDLQGFSIGGTPLEPLGLAADGAGNIVIAYRNSSGVVSVARSSNNGTSWAVSTVLIGGNPISPDHPGPVASEYGGTWRIAWHDLDEENASVNAISSTNNGSTWDDLASYNGGLASMFDEGLAIACGPDDTFAIVWCVFDTRGVSRMATVHNGSVARITALGPSPYDRFEDLRPTVAYDGDGSFLAAADQLDYYAWPIDRHIANYHIDGSGESWVSASDNDLYPMMASNYASSNVVVYLTSNSGYLGVQSAYSSGGSTSFSNTSALSTSSYMASRPCVAGSQSSSSTWCAAWYAVPTPGGGTPQIQYSHSTNNFSGVASSGTVVTNSGVGYPILGMGASGTFVLVWGNSSNSSIYCSIGS